MPKQASRGNDRDDDLEVVMTEVDPNDVDNNEDDEIEGRDSNLSEVEDEDQDDLEDHDEDQNEDDDDQDDEPEPRRESRQQRQAPKGNPRDAFLKRLKRAERQIAEVRDENAELANSNQRMGAELQKLKSGGDVEKAKKDAEAKLSDVRAKLKVAIEAGDSDAQARLTEELADIKADVKKAEALAEASKGATDAGGPVERYQRLAAQWKRKHQRFNTDPVFSSYVAAIDRSLAGEGYNRNTDRYFAELDKRVKERYPEEYGKTPPRRQQHPASGPDADGGSNRDGNRQRPAATFQRKGKAHVLSRRQEGIMRKVGLDPTDPEDRKTFVRENL
jgi:hypothetical protein